MVQKVVGKVGQDQKDFYCDAGEIKTNRVSYGTTRKVKTVTKKLLKKKSKCIKTSVAGKEIAVQCNPCTDKQTCQKQGGAEECHAVKVYDANFKSKPDCPACN